MNLKGDNNNIRKLFPTTLRNIEVNITFIIKEYTDKMVQCFVGMLETFFILSSYIRINY